MPELAAWVLVAVVTVFGIVLATAACLDVANQGRVRDACVETEMAALKQAMYRERQEMRSDMSQIRMVLRQYHTALCTIENLAERGASATRIKRVASETLDMNRGKV